MKVNPGVQPEEMKKLAQKGIQDPSRGSGNHYVKLKVEIPKYEQPHYRILIIFFLSRNLSADQISQLKTILDGKSSKSSTSSGSWCKSISFYYLDFLFLLQLEVYRIQNLLNSYLK